MSHPDPITLPGSSTLLRAVRHMLRPLVRMLIRNGITFPVLADLLRGLYVEVAANDLLTDAKARTDSRISLMTGVHRKEIRRLRAETPEDPPVPEVITTGTQVMSRWLALASADGVPPPLPRSAAGEATSFERLISTVTTDVRPRALLEEWLSQGLVRVDDQDYVHLNTAAFIPRPGGEEQQFFFGRNLADHIAAATANLAAGDTAPYLDRSVHYDGMSPETIRRLEEAARAAAMRALVEVNRLASDLADTQPATPQAQPAGRFNFGIYIYRDDGKAG